MNCYDGEILYTLRETRIVIESWRRSLQRLSGRMGTLGYKPPAPEVFSARPSPRGRLRYTDLLRRPR